MNDATPPPEPDEGPSEFVSWLQFFGGVFLGLIVWIPSAFVLGVLGVASSGQNEGVLVGIVSAFVPGLIQIPGVVLLAIFVRGSGRRGLLVGAGIVAFLNASCWGLLFGSQAVL